MNNKSEYSIQEFIDEWKNKDIDLNKPEKYNKIYYFYKKDNQNIEIKDENAIILQFVNENPFVSYKKFIIIALQNNLIEKNAKLPYDIYLLTKIIYENPTNEDKIIDYGQRIYKLGGSKLIKFVYSILSIIHKQYLDPVVSGQQAIYDKCWKIFFD